MCGTTGREYRRNTSNIFLTAAGLLRRGAGEEKTSSGLGAVHRADIGPPLWGRPDGGVGVGTASGASHLVPVVPPTEGPVSNKGTVKFFPAFPDLMPTVARRVPAVAAVFAVAVVMALLAAGCVTPVPRAGETPTPTLPLPSALPPTPSPTATREPSPEPSPTPTAEPAPTPTSPPAPTPTAMPTARPSPNAATNACDAHPHSPAANQGRPRRADVAGVCAG